MTQRKIIFSIFTVILFIGVLFFFVSHRFSNKIDSNEEMTTAPLPPVQNFDTNKATIKESPEESPAVKKDLPKEFLLSVPFTPQAPTANWDELHNEACEEASVLMANAFFKGDSRSTLPPAEAETEIEKLTKWQQDNLGYYLSIDAAETERMIESVYGLKAEVVRNFSEDTIKTALTENKLVLVPVDGRLLGNPNFQSPGPIYHMFVIKGYDEKSFIVNEPGTKRGQDYRYTYETIRNAVGDYKHDSKVTNQNDPAIIIVSE